MPRFTGSTWWAPRARAWWIAVLFAVGSLLFALGALPAYAGAVGTTRDALTFFIGSLFFTSAGFLTYREAVDAGPQPPGAQRRRFFVRRTSSLDWWASGVQLVGTLFFNLSTGYALQQNFTAQEADKHVWRPDALGSICFLIASALAWFAVSHRWVAWQPRSWLWWIALANLLGSVAFGVSAAASYVVPSTDQLRNLERTNLGTFVGAVCFFVGALLLLPERADELSAEADLRSSA